MAVDPRVAEAFALLSTPGGPVPDQQLRARALLRDWLDDRELADFAEEEDDASTWADAAPLELLHGGRGSA